MAIHVSTSYLGDGTDIQDAINQLQSAGITKVELGSNHAFCNLKTLKLHKGSDYIAHNYFPPGDPNFVLNLASEKSQICQLSIEFIKNTIKLCQELNIKFYTIHPGFLGEAAVPKRRGSARNFDFKFKRNITPGNRLKILDRTIKIIKQLYKYSRKHSVQLLVENEGSKTSKEFIIFASSKELTMLKNGVEDSLKFNFNLAHATLAGIDLSDEKIFGYFSKDSEFFEVSEIQGIYDSHLPINLQRGEISSLIKKYSKFFAQKNIILEYRNIDIKEVKKSYDYVVKLLNSGSPKVE